MSCGTARTLSNFVIFWIVKWIRMLFTSRNLSIVPWLNGSRILNKGTLLWEIPLDAADLGFPVLLFYSLTSHFLSLPLYIMNKKCSYILYYCAHNYFLWTFYFHKKRTKCHFSWRKGRTKDFYTLKIFIAIRIITVLSQKQSILRVRAF